MTKENHAGIKCRSSKLRLGRPPIESITEVQRRALENIRGFITRRGFPPTVKELGELLGITTASAHEQVGQLIRKGYLRRDAHKARSLEVVKDPEMEISGLIAIPVVGSVAAGQPILAVENIVGELLVESKIASIGRYFALKVKGDSMIGAGINSGDFVVVRQQPIAENGDIVVALLDNEATVKRLHVCDTCIELRPENPRLKPIPVGPDDDLRIAGKVVAIRNAPTPTSHTSRTRRNANG